VRDVLVSAQASRGQAHESKAHARPEARPKGTAYVRTVASSEDAGRGELLLGSADRTVASRIDKPS